MGENAAKTDNFRTEKINFPLFRWISLPDWLGKQK